MDLKETTDKVIKYKLKYSAQELEDKLDKVDQEYSLEEKEKLNGLKNYDDSQIKSDVNTLTENKLDKNQGIENSGKVLGTNANGEVIPLNGYGFEYDEETKMLKYGTDPTSNLNQGIGLDDTLSKRGYAADAGAVGELKEDLVKKIDKPTIEDNNKFPRAKDGSVEWVEHGLPTDEQTDSAIANWLNSHPEATTTVEDNSLTIDKMVIGTLGYVTPEMYGAVGDGETDDSTAFIAAVNSGYNVICKDNGNYLISGNVVCDAQSIIFDGNGAKITVDITSETRVTALNFRHTAIVKNLNLVTDIASNVGGLSFSDTNTTNTYTINCYIKGFGLYGVVNCSNVINTIFENCCQLSGAQTGNGYYFSSRNNIIISNCTFLCDGGGDNLDHAIYSGGSGYSNIKILDSTFVLKSESCKIGPLINVCGSLNEKQTECIIANNFIDYSLSKTVDQAAVAVSLENSIISNNIIFGGNNAGGASLFVVDAVKVLVSENVLTNKPISISKADDLVIARNDIHTGIRLYGSSINTLKNVKIINNTITGNINSPDHYFSNVIIADNVINGMIYLLTAAESNNLLIRNNLIYSMNLAFAIVIGKYTDVLVERNTVYSNDDGEENTRGIVFYWGYQDWYSGKNNICKDNYVQNTKGEDYYLVNVVSINNIGKNNTVVT